MDGSVVRIHSFGPTRNIAGFYCTTGWYEVEISALENSRAPEERHRVFVLSAVHFSQQHQVVRGSDRGNNYRTVSPTRVLLLFFLQIGAIE